MLSIPKYLEKYAQLFPAIFYLLCCAFQHHVGGFGGGGLAAEEGFSGGVASRWGGGGVRGLAEVQSSLVETRWPKEVLYNNGGLHSTSSPMQWWF